MTIIEKIKQSVEGATGMPFLYHAAGELNELLARCKELPVAYSFLIDSGTIDDVNGRYHERVTIAVMFCDKTDFDFNAIENEQIIDRMKVKAYKWMQSLRMSNALRVVSVNNTQRLYDNTTDILTGFAVNITLEDVAGVGECELPDVVFEIKENGEYPVVGIDKVIANVLPKSTDIVIEENGEYIPNDYDVDAFSKVVADVKPRLEELTATDNGTYTPSAGFDGFGKVNVDLKGKVKVSSFTVSKSCINEEGIWEGDVLIDKSECTSFNRIFWQNNKIKKIDISNWNTYKATDLSGMFGWTGALTEIIGVEKLTNTKPTKVNQMFVGNRPITVIDFIDWDMSNLVKYGLNNFADGWKLKSCVAGRTVEEVIENDIKVFNGLKITVNTLFSSGTIDRASLRAIINGLADLTGQTTQTLTLGATNRGKLIEEDIAVATNKNWTIV